MLVNRYADTALDFEDRWQAACLCADAVRWPTVVVAYAGSSLCALLGRHASRYDSLRHYRSSAFSLFATQVLEPYDRYDGDDGLITLTL